MQAKRYLGCVYLSTYSLIKTSILIYSVQRNTAAVTCVGSSISYRIINEATQTSVDLLKKYEETIKLDEEKLRAKVPKTKSVWSVYEYLKVSPVTSIPITAEHLNLSYNSVSKAFATLKKYNIIMQRNNSTRNRIWEYTCLDFIFTLPSINQVTCN